VPQTVWIDVGQGIDVTPRWSGGRDVVVDIEARLRQPVQPGSAYGAQLDPDGQTRRTELASTLSVPLGEWVVVARNGGRSQRAQSGTLSTRDVDEGQSEQLEIRVTAP
jgi:type II secretory pathway component GspD/PulD (secretin)